MGCNTKGHRACVCVCECVGVCVFKSSTCIRWTGGLFVAVMISQQPFSWYQERVELAVWKSDLEA